MSDPRDPYLELPLEGVRLIEASAGTGKTFTLATLVTRLVVECGLRVGQILAVTFTEAATQELRKRIRERLQLTLNLLDASDTDDQGAEARLTRELLQAHRTRGHESDDALRRRLRQATLETDLAAIFTIHGFCARVLREHALESGLGFDAPELLGNDRELRAELAADLWRVHAQDAGDVDDLVALWSGHEALAEDLQALLREPVLLPPLLPLLPDPTPELHAAGAALADTHRAHGEAFFDALLAAVDAKVLHGNSYRKDWIEALRGQLSAWCAAGDVGVVPDERIARLTRDAMRGKANKDREAQVPESPCCASIAAYLEALQAQGDYRARRRIALLHRVRDDARMRLATLKRQRRLQTYDDLIDGVADALAGERAELLASALRAQYAVALVDEFQDTDARQWAIFERVFGAASSNGQHDRADPADVDGPLALESVRAGGSQARFLALIGDPKQAIYGFRGGDVHTYLAAAGVAAPAPPLSHNFRSRPSLLAAIAALYGNAQAAFDARQVDAPPFVDQRIRFFDVAAGGKREDADFLRGGHPAPAIGIWQAPAPPVDDKGKRKPWRAEQARMLATAACVAAIHAVLSEARAGTAMLKDKGGMRAVRPGDIAVLVRSHREATMVQQALAQAGIAAVAAGKQSLFATAEARELHALLLALLHSGDDGRLRAALASVLVGVDANGVEALEHDPDAHRNWQQRALGWRERLLRGGPLAMVGDLCAANGERLLGLLDGERRMSNYLQLAELLQEAKARALGLHGLVDWLGQRIASADRNDEAQLLRLESDAHRVQIVTLHKSKGLEYPLVFLPFIGIGRKDASAGRCCVAHDAGNGRRLHWNLAVPDAQWDEARAQWKADQRAEDARLLYVGLTRAEHALWIATGDFFASGKTPLHAMLLDPGALAEAGVVFDADALPAALPRLSSDAEAGVPAARKPARRLAHDWWVYSFSQLARADAGSAHALDTASAATLPASGGNDEPDAGEDMPVEADFDPRFAGNRYGVALHAALEHADFAAWRHWRPGSAAPDDQAKPLAEALRAQGYADDVLDDGIALTAQLVGHTLGVGLPEGVRLCDIADNARRAEIEFQFALQPTRTEALLALLHAHGIVRERQGFGVRQTLEGLMTGLIDLTYRHAGKWYVLDYKSNRLPGYDAAHLAQAMAHGEYDLQALIYTLALHRWLRFRLGDRYDYARDFGGIRYLFCRGLDAGSSTSPGIHAQRFAPELVHALDALFGHAEGAAA